MVKELLVSKSRFIGADGRDFYPKPKKPDFYEPRPRESTKWPKSGQPNKVCFGRSRSEEPKRSQEVRSDSKSLKREPSFRSEVVQASQISRHGSRDGPNLKEIEMKLEKSQAEFKDLVARVGRLEAEVEHLRSLQPVNVTDMRIGSRRM